MIIDILTTSLNIYTKIKSEKLGHKLKVKVLYQFLILNEIQLVMGAYIYLHELTTYTNTILSSTDSMVKVPHDPSFVMKCVPSSHY